MPAGPVAYGWQWVLWLDLGLNVSTGGYAAELFSSRCYRRRIETDAPGWHRLEFLVNVIFFWQPDHCENSFLYQKALGGLPSAYK